MKTIPLIMASCFTAVGLIAVRALVVHLRRPTVTSKAHLLSMTGQVLSMGAFWLISTGVDAGAVPLLVGGLFLVAGRVEKKSTRMVDEHRPDHEIQQLKKRIAP